MLSLTPASAFSDSPNYVGVRGCPSSSIALEAGFDYFDDPVGLELFKRALDPLEGFSVDDYCRRPASLTYNYRPIFEIIDDLGRVALEICYRYLLEHCCASFESKCAFRC
jgi:hypothetical protein